MPERMNEHVARSRPGLFAPESPVRTVLLVLLAYAVLGALAGVVWEWLWTPPGQVIQQHHVFYDSYASLRREFTGTGFYVVVGIVTSALGAVASCLLTRGRELLVLVLVVVGSAIGAAVMWRIGTLLGPADPASLAAHTVTRTRVPGQLAVAGKSPYLAWPLASLFVLAILYFAWPGSHPTHAHAHAADPHDPDPS
jgi:hypothetical protein